MRTVARSLVLVLAGVTAAGVSITPAGAAVSGAVIVANDRTTGTGVELPAGGGAIQPVACGGDLLSFGSSRDFLHLQAAADGSYQLFAYTEDCAPIAQLTNDTALTRTGARWSPNGVHVAFGGTRTDPTTGAVTERGIFVGDVQLDANGAPASITNERLAVALGDEHVVTSWAADGCRIAYSAPVPTPSGGTQNDLFAANVCGSLPATPIDVTNTSNVSEFDPAFSPVANVLAFVERTNKGGLYRNDVFVLDLGTGSIRQITSKSNANVLQIGRPTWSPDGTSIAFDGVTSSATSAYDVYRMPATGTQKSTCLTCASPDSFMGAIWRA